MRKRLLQALVPLAGVGLLLLGLVIVGRTARDWLRHEDRYAFSFSDIDGPAPPGMERPAFLGEVQYLSRFPDRFSLFDEDLPARLQEAFARHPWVQTVEEVRVVPP